MNYFLYGSLTTHIARQGQTQTLCQQPITQQNLCNSTKETIETPTFFRCSKCAEIHQTETHPVKANKPTKTAKQTKSRATKKKSKDFEGKANIEELRKDTFVHLYRANKPTKKVYFTEGYCKSSKKYIITDTDDINAQRYIKKGTPVLVTTDY